MYAGSSGKAGIGALVATCSCVADGEIAVGGWDGAVGDDPGALPLHPANKAAARHTVAVRPMNFLMISSFPLAGYSQKLPIRFFGSPDSIPVLHLEPIKKTQHVGMSGLHASMRVRGFPRRHGLPSLSAGY